MIRDSGCWLHEHEICLALGLRNNWHQMVRFCGAFGPKAERAAGEGGDRGVLKDWL